MTLAIRSSLGNLNRAIQKLEMTAADLEVAQSKAAAKAKEKKKPEGNDLFSFPSSVGSNTDAKALASRLDGAIAKVEKLLREGDDARG